MRVLIAVDLTLMRSAIRRLLNEEEGVEVVGEAANLSELTYLTRTLSPDVILLKWDLSGMPGSSKAGASSSLNQSRAEKRRNVILASLRRYPSHPCIIVLSNHPEVEELACRLGLSGFVFTADPPERLIAAIRMMKDQVV